MTFCSTCKEDVDLKPVADVSGDWVEVVLVCPICGTRLVGWIQIDHMDPCDELEQP